MATLLAMRAGRRIDERALIDAVEIGNHGFETAAITGFKGPE
jgi:hypothetical protein